MYSLLCSFIYSHVNIVALWMYDPDYLFLLLFSWIYSFSYFDIKMSEFKRENDVLCGATEEKSLLEHGNFQ